MIRFQAVCPINHSTRCIDSPSNYPTLPDTLRYTPPVPKVSVTVITRNESANLGAALESVSWADEIVVVDSESTDDTLSIARRFTDRVDHAGMARIRRPEESRRVARQPRLDSVAGRRRARHAGAGGGDQIVARDHASQLAFRIPRVTWHLGRWIRTTDWYPDYQTRLYDRRSARWTGQYVHESLSVDGAVGQLTGELQHYPYRDIADHLETIGRYTTYAAQQMRDNGRHAGLLQMAAHPPLAFLRNYILRGGFRDGVPGFIISALNAYYVFLKFAKLRELQTETVPEFARRSLNPEPDLIRCSLCTSTRRGRGAAARTRCC